MEAALLSTTPRQVPRSSTDDSVLKRPRYVNSGCNSDGECKPASPRMLCHQVMGCVEKARRRATLVGRDQQTATLREPGPLGRPPWEAPDVGTTVNQSAVALLSGGSQSVRAMLGLEGEYPCTH
jgi:hypothetical protein